MKTNYISTIICASLALLIWNICGIRAEAGEREAALQSIYEQIITDRENTATVEYSGDIIPIDEIQLYFNDMDKPEDLFDGKVACERGHYHSVKKGNRYTLEIQDAYNVDEADALTDMMAEEISSKLDSNASDRMKMAAICDYLTETFSYNKDLGTAIDNNITSKHHNFVDAYNGDRKLLCGDFAQLTYLIANKMGINCGIVYGVDHVYNIVKFADADHYIGYDLASDSRYAQITLVDYLANDIYHLEKVQAGGSRNDPRVLMAMNNGVTYEYAGARDIINDFLYFALVAHHLPELVILALIVLTILSMIANKFKRIKHSISRERTNNLAKV